MSTHTGTHIDAPFHFSESGMKVMDLDVNRYVGKAKVIDVSSENLIQVEDLVNINLDECKIVLFKTMSWTDRTTFPTNITYVKTGVAQWLAERGVTLIGVDVPSVDPVDSKELPAHHELSSHNIHILEGLVLDKIQEGVYELIALPLPVVGADASPVRAIIRPI
jgi:arylformamidase